MKLIIQNNNIKINQNIITTDQYRLKLLKAHITWSLNFNTLKLKDFLKLNNL